MYGCELTRKHARDGGMYHDYGDDMRSLKKFKMEGDCSLLSIESWEDGFVQGIIQGWELLEHTALPCGCSIVHDFVIRQFYAILHQLDKELVDRNGIKIISILMRYLKAKNYLLDRMGGVISPFVLAESPFSVRHLLFGYNFFVERVNREHQHDFSCSEWSYFS